MHTDVIRRAWPELLEFPFNEDLPVPPGRSRLFAVKTRLTSALEVPERLVRRTCTRLAAKRPLAAIGCFVIGEPVALQE